VIYSGLHQTPSQIAETAVQEDVDAVGLSSLSGAHKTLFPQVVEQLAHRDSADIMVFGGGVIPEADIPKLHEAGIATIFTPGTPLDEIAVWVDANVPGKV
jgi:methylmalonyl-CoA mutase C-terminal domain/subunit